MRTLPRTQHNFAELFRTEEMVTCLSLDREHTGMYTGGIIIRPLDSQQHFPTADYRFTAEELINGWPGYKRFIHHMEQAVQGAYGLSLPEHHEWFKKVLSKMKTPGTTRSVKQAITSLYESMQYDYERESKFQRKTNGIRYKLYSASLADLYEDGAEDHADVEYVNIMFKVNKTRDWEMIVFLSTQFSEAIGHQEYLIKENPRDTIELLPLLRKMLFKIHNNPKTKFSNLDELERLYCIIENRLNADAGRVDHILMRLNNAFYL